MELQRLIKRKKKAMTVDDKLDIAKTSKDLGNWYNTNANYEQALEEYKNEAKAYFELGNKLENAKAHRMIGEMYMLLSNFSNALKHAEIYLGKVRELENKIEEQRALATIGRIHLLHGQSVSDTDITKQQLKLAEKAFMKSLLLCESLRGEISYHELMDMRARLLLNLGVVLEHLENYKQSIEFMDRAIAICIKQDLFELLHQCYSTKGLLLHQREQDYSKALHCFNKALTIAERLPEKISKMCETLTMKAEVYISQHDLQSAKQMFIKAWKLKCPDKIESKNIEKKLKIVASMCYTMDALDVTKPTNYELKKKLNEKMGDGYCFFKKYTKAITYYLEMLESAKLNNEKDKDLIPIYVSLYQTYRDNKQYDEALKYYWQEYELCSNIPREAFNTLINISEVLELSNRQFETIEAVYVNARQQAKKLSRASLEILCIKKLINLKKKFGKPTDKLQEELDNLKDSASDSSSSDSESNTSENTPDIGDDICIEDLSDISDPETSEKTDRLYNTRKKSKSMTLRKNDKGETQLHTACISGNIVLVQRFLNQKHPVNIRDNAGWLPLHEACLHGHKEIAELLLEAGAHINDRGGTACDGITPLFDAASNGHLEVIELLLNRGASAKLLTDEGESALDVLIRWKENTDLSAIDKMYYETIYNKLKTAIGKRPSGTEMPLKARISDGIKLSNENNSVVNLRFEPDNLNNENYFENENNAYVSPNKISDKSACKEYKNIMKNLRNRAPDIKQYKTCTEIEKKRPALVNASEVVDDWLEDDLQQNKMKRRKTSMYKVNQTAEQPTTFSKSYSNESLDEIVSENFNDNLNLNNSNKRVTKRKRQTSLLDTGFTKEKSVSPNIEEMDNNTDHSLVTQTQSPFKVQYQVSNQPLSLSIVPPIPVKVRVQDRVLVVPVMSHLIDSLNIAWLSRETSKRYYTLVGLEPTITLTMPDGALLTQDDPLSLVLGISELQSNILKWNLPPLHERYLEACSQLGCEVNINIQNLLNMCQATQSLNFGDLGLELPELQPVFRSLNHQANLKEIILKSNTITDEGVKLLCSSLPTLKQLKVLDLSVNSLSYRSLSYISELVSDKPCLQELVELNIGCNLLGDESWQYLAIILNKLKLQKLILCSCDLEDFSRKLVLPLQYITWLDISYNDIQQKSFANLLSNLNGNIIEYMNLSRIPLNDDAPLVKELIDFFNNSSLKNLTMLCLMGCDINDANLQEMLRTLMRAQNLNKINLSNNFKLSSISLRRLMQHRPCIKNIILDGCINILKYLGASNVYEEFDNLAPEFISLTVDRSIEEENLKMDIVLNMWVKLWTDQAVIKHGTYGSLFLSTSKSH